MALRLIQVGLGGWGSDWQATALQTIADRVEVVGIVEAVPALLEAARTRFDYAEDQCFADLGSALAGVEADAVLITAPAAVHIPLAIQAMRAGKHVLCEKPMAPTVEEALEGIQVSEETGCHLQISQNYRFYPAPRLARTLLREGSLGEVARIGVDFRQWVHDAPAGGNPYYAVPNVLLGDMAIHQWDMMRMLLGCDATEILVTPMDPTWSKFADCATATAIVRFENGVEVSYRGSWMSRDVPTYWAGDWRIECEEGLIGFTSRRGGPFGIQGDRVWTRTAAGIEDIPMEPMAVWGRSAGVLDFARWIETGVPSENAAARNIGSLAILEAAVRSVASGDWEAVTVPTGD